MSDLPLTICILTNRADARFDACLHSARWAKNICVLDNNSGVQWEKLKQNLPQLHVIPFSEKLTNFAEARTKLLNTATTEWIFFLDSDEELPEDAQVIMGNVIHSGAAGATVLRRDVFLGKKLYFSEGGRQRLLRLAKKNCTTITGSVHETLRVQGLIQETNLCILHTAHTSVSEFLRDVARYSEMAAKEKSSGKLQIILELLTFPLAKFILGYLLRGGFRDGWRGLTYAVIMSIHSIAVRCFRYEQLRP